MSGAATTGSESSRTRTLGRAFDPRRNNFDALRLIFAAGVGVAHGAQIRAGWQPHWGATTFGDFALDGFFVLSGFLVAASFLRLSSFPRFAWHRFLRIMPAFWVCLLVVALVVAPAAALLQGLSATTGFTEEPSAWRFLLGNAGLHIVQYDIGGILDGRWTTAFNGSLWTLSFEAFCYGVVALFGVLGLLRGRRAAVLAATLGLAALTVAKEAGLVSLFDGDLLGGVLRLLFVFLLGTLGYLYADVIPMRTDLAAIALALFAVSPLLFADYRVLGAVPLAYLYLWVATSLPWSWSMRVDVSYGVYIYHYPIFQLMGLTLLVGLPTPLFIVVGLVLTLGPAAASWFLVEKPALARKHSPLPDRVAAAVRSVVGRSSRGEGPRGRHRDFSEPRS